MIERLKELKDYLRVANELSILNDDNLMQRIVDNNDVANTIDIAIELLNAEIARQSVTDEQIRTALDYVSDYKKEAIAYDTSVGIFPPTSEEVMAWETIETALRQYQKPSEWIPVSERLPEEKDASANNKILVLFDNGFVDIWNYLVFVYHVTSNAEFGLAQITHWMPLPKPPESDAKQVTNVMQDSLQDESEATMLTEKQIDQTMAELHDGIRSLDIWDALWLMGVQAKQAIDLAAENERLKAKAKHYVCVRERNRETINDLKGKLNAAESENERLKAKLDEIRAECNKTIEFNGEVGEACEARYILAIIDKDVEVIW